MEGGHAYTCAPCRHGPCGRSHFHRTSLYRPIKLTGMVKNLPLLLLLDPRLNGQSLPRIEFVERPAEPKITALPFYTAFGTPMRSGTLGGFAVAVRRAVAAGYVQARRVQSGHPCSALDRLTPCTPRRGRLCASVQQKLASWYVQARHAPSTSTQLRACGYVPTVLIPCVRTPHPAAAGDANTLGSDCEAEETRKWRLITTSSQGAGTSQSSCPPPRPPRRPWTSSSSAGASQSCCLRRATLH